MLILFISYYSSNISSFFFDLNFDLYFINFPCHGWHGAKKYLSKKFSFNVPGIRRLGQDIGLCIANVPCPKCGGDKTVQRAQPDYGFSEPGGGEQPPERIPFVRRWFFAFPIY